MKFEMKYMSGKNELVVANGDVLERIVAITNSNYSWSSADIDIP